MGSITSDDVAREAGLSRATVSYVLNDTPGQSIPEATRRRVLDAADRLGYVPNPGARALRLGRSDAVLLPLGDVSLTTLFGHAVNVCSATLNRHGFTLVADATRYETADAAARSWLRLAPAAFIDLTMPTDDPTASRLADAGIPRVVADIDVPARLSAMDVIAIEARRRQLLHLVECGARRVVYCAPQWVYDLRSGPFLRAALGSLAERHGTHLRFEVVEQTRESVGRAARRWARRQRPPDAVAVHSDSLAVPILTALTARGVDVPRQLLVIGVDDDPLSAAVTPSLSSIYWAVEQLGEALAGSVRAAIGKPDTPARYAPPELRVIPRLSTSRRS